MVSDLCPLVKYLENLREFAITFGLHQKKGTPVSFTLDRAITRIQEAYDFDCQCVSQVKAFLGTTAQTQGPQGTVSTVVLEDEKRILQALKEIKDLLSQHAPQLLEVIKMKSLLTLICENFFAEMRAGSYDMPLQLQFDFRFNRALKEHLKQMCRTKFCYYTNVKSHCPRVKSDLRYSEPPKMSPISSAQLTKSQVQQMRDWRIKHGQSAPQKTVRNMSTKDNPGTLPINLYLTEQPTSQPFYFGKIGEVQGETVLTCTAREREGKDGSSDLVQLSGDIVYLSSDASSSKMKLYVLQQDVTTVTKKARAMCFDADVFNPLTFTEEAEREINVKDICGSLAESFVNDKIIQMTENEFIHYQSHMISHVDSVTIEGARECEGEDQEQSNTALRRSRRAKKRAHFEEFMYYDD